MLVEKRRNAGWPVERRLLAPKLYYFCHFAAMGFLAPFLVLYYRELGLSGTQIGLLTSIGPLISLVGATLWGAVADAAQQHKRLLLIAIGGTMAMVAVLAMVRNPVWLLPVVALYAFFSSPVMPLVDNSVMELLGDHPERYGQQRLWGALGWGVAGMVAGIMIAQVGLGAAFGGFLLLMGMGFLAAVQIPVSGQGIGNRFWQGALLLMRNWQWAAFLITVTLAGIAHGIMNNYLFLYLSDLNASERLMGMTLAIATVSELPIFFFSDTLLRRFGPRNLLLIGLAAQVVRMSAYAVMPAAWVALPISLLHGLTFSGMWVAGVAYASRVAPAGMGATAQGMLSGMMMGVGTASGALLGGWLYDGVGPERTFWAGALGVLVALLFFANVKSTKSSTG